MDSFNSSVIVIILDAITRRIKMFECAPRNCILDLLKSSGISRPRPSYLQLQISTTPPQVILYGHLTPSTVTWLSVYRYLMMRE